MENLKNLLTYSLNILLYLCYEVLIIVPMIKVKFYRNEIYGNVIVLVKEVVSIIEYYTKITGYTYSFIRYIFIFILIRKYLLYKVIEVF